MKAELAAAPKQQTPVAFWKINKNIEKYCEYIT